MNNSAKQKLLMSAAVLACILGCLWLSFGVYSDREFGGLHLFRKHQLSVRFFFHSPRGESDNPEVNDAERSAEQDYTEFVELKGGREHSWTLFK